MKNTKNEKVIAFVPAKGYSERIKNKNMQILDGEYLFKRKLRQLLGCEEIDEVWLDSDSEEMDYSNKQDTHFYKMGLREKDDAYTMEKWWSRIKVSAKFIKRGLDNRNGKWENLSRGFENHKMIPKNTLENII